MNALRAWLLRRRIRRLQSRFDAVMRERRAMSAKVNAAANALRAARAFEASCGGELNLRAE